MCRYSPYLQPSVQLLVVSVEQLVRNISINLEVRVDKQNRATGVLGNFAVVETYVENGMRKLVRKKSPEIVPCINKLPAEVSFCYELKNSRAD
ncbi:hypothetical protein ZIOFF_022405 [Zingiber officinale]|uniref:Uncharacterized protein n=1 Tax=Zingiber officinale TaxID=94328 RepID=A0A8J5H317_ZINOF|nr:hypothetical protein ZIOFF_022405 [Zingiber officinale]